MEVTPDKKHNKTFIRSKDIKGVRLMPYINICLREWTKDELKDLTDKLSQCGMGIGELNFLITNLCIKYIKLHGEKYENFNAVVGALECAKLELYRRKIADYENVKIKENGDVY